MPLSSYFPKREWIAAACELMVKHSPSDAGYKVRSMGLDALRIEVLTIHGKHMLPGLQSGYFSRLKPI
jgi:hypothetical protein